MIRMRKVKVVGRWCHDSFMPWSRMERLSKKNYVYRNIESKFDRRRCPALGLSLPVSMIELMKWVGWGSVDGFDVDDF